ncbi:MAG: hypothetical protein LUI06_07430 [Ruminococcus sp.]|nr:hypothetical protein [Ruminococcus sp.]
MKDIMGNIWVKRCVSIFEVTYLAVIAMFAYATFLYDLVFVNGKEASFLVIYAVASIIFLILMLYTRDMFVTKAISVLLLPIVFFLLLFNLSNNNWTLIIPPLIVALVIFFASATTETIKVILGTIYLLLYVLGIVVYVACNILFSGSDVETVLDMDLDPESTLYAQYEDQLVHLAEVTDDDNAISPDGRYRFYLTDVEDSDKGCVKIYVVPNGQDIKLQFFSLNQKGIRKTITTKGTRYIVPDVGWTVEEDDDGNSVLYVAYRLTEDSSWTKSKVTNMPDKNYLEFLGITG